MSQVRCFAVGAEDCAKPATCYEPRACAIPRARGAPRATLIPLVNFSNCIKRHLTRWAYLEFSLESSNTNPYLRMGLEW